MDPRAIEIQVFCMTGDHLTTRDEEVGYYDVVVSYEADEDGHIEIIEEHEDILKEHDLDCIVHNLEHKYGVIADTVDGS